MTGVGGVTTTGGGGVITGADGAAAIVVIDPVEDLIVCAVTLTDVPLEFVAVRTDTGAVAATGALNAAASPLDAEAVSVLEEALEAGVPAAVEDVAKSSLFSGAGARDWSLGTGPA